jgi:hypothetical protein
LVNRHITHSSFDEGTKEFIVDHYLPEIQKATAHMRPLPDDEKSKLTGNVVGTLMKLFYAFLWQVILK